ncbi:MAG: ATP synthase F1 subunit gamma [Heliobacteriaceae bacterium]|nr:ATP synthase F1 subunit gamma [Heliobacteriaceae bacterium]
MAGMRDIKRRIRSIKSTQQITKAMKMVAAAKLRRAQESVIQARPYAARIQDVLGRLSQGAAGVKNPLLEKREGNKVGYIIVTADRGLCGGYNGNLIRMVNNTIRGQSDVSVVCIGRKSRDFFRRIGVKIEAEFLGIGDLVTYAQAEGIANKVVQMYADGVFDEVRLVFTEFISPLTQRPRDMKLLPIEPVTSKEEQTEAQAVQPLYIYEPSAEDVLNVLLPKYVNTLIYRALLEAKASEHGARMTAMSSATDNAAEMIDKLTLSFNRARQAAITKEIAEVVGGAAALG